MKTNVVIEFDTENDAFEFVETLHSIADVYELYEKVENDNEEHSLVFFATLREVMFRRTCKLMRTWVFWKV